MTAITITMFFAFVLASFVVLSVQIACSKAHNTGRKPVRKN